VAYSENENLYPAGAAIMWQSNPWPGDVDSFRVSVAVLRPVFDQKLAEIPAEMKEKVYPVGADSRILGKEILKPEIRTGLAAMDLVVTATSRLGLLAR
jgi:hypothetical protein